MAMYNQPVRPYDPVIEDSQDNQSIRYYRENFSATGQESHVEPPAQDQSMWELLTNVMPITRGSIRRRRGAIVQGQTPQPAQRLATFQRDSDGLRVTVAICENVAVAYNEDHSLYNQQIFVSQALTRMLTSRSYAYFFSSNSADLRKWDGNPTLSAGLTNWGIPFVTSTGQVSVTPNGTLAGDLTGTAFWLTPTNALLEDNTFTTFTTAVPNGDTPPLYVHGFGFSIPSNATITGLTVRVKMKASTSPDQLKVIASITKDGTTVLSGQGAVVTNQTVNTSYTFGSATDLWSQSFLPNDINSPSFGVTVVGANGPSSTSIAWAVDVVQVTVSYLGATNAPTVADGGAGNVTLTVGRLYYQVFKSSKTAHLSDLGPASASTGPLTSRQIALSTLAVSNDPQVDRTILLATADGADPSILYFVTDLANGTHTYTDNTPEATLVLNQQYLFTDQFGNDFGVADNTPPPSGMTLAIKHKGRLWGVVGQNLFFSKSTSDLTLPNGFIAGKYEEAWPADQYLDISEGAEQATGLLSNGQVLFIGTERHIRWVTGDDPTNFSEPEVVHAEVGLATQEVWQSVFTQGTPAGCIWLTPDKRVIMSDFNTYMDIGTAVQDVLDIINPAAIKASHATFVTDGEMDLYILAIPTGVNTACDTHLVFNMNTHQWVVWKPSTGSLALLFNVTSDGVPQWLYSTQFNNNIFEYTNSTATDMNPGGPPNIAIPVTARTSWLHLGSPTHRKLLDELEVIGDPAMQITVEGASPELDFTTPTIYKNAVTPTVGPFQQLKVYLASSGAKDRYYRLTFFSPGGTNAKFLHAYNLKAIPFNTL